jgi:hypothetical protein
MATLQCPHCGWKYDPALRWGKQTPYELVPTHDFPVFPEICPGSQQHPRNPESDKRPFWKDLPIEEPTHARST